MIMISIIKNEINRFNEWHNSVRANNKIYRNPWMVEVVIPTHNRMGIAQLMFPLMVRGANFGLVLI